MLPWYPGVRPSILRFSILTDSAFHRNHLRQFIKFLVVAHLCFGLSMRRINAGISIGESQIAGLTPGSSLKG
jgi:hypothetical protein